MTPEGKVKKALRKILDGLGVYYFMPPANGYGRAGIPDFILCVSGAFVAIECKAGTNTPTALQLREMEKINAAGGYSFVVNESNIDQIARWIQTFKRVQKPQSQELDQ